MSVLDQQSILVLLDLVKDFDRQTARAVITMLLFLTPLEADGVYSRLGRGIRRGEFKGHDEILRRLYRALPSRQRLELFSSLAMSAASYQVYADAFRDIQKRTRNNNAARAMVARSVSRFAATHELAEVKRLWRLASHLLISRNQEEVWNALLIVEKLGKANKRELKAVVEATRARFWGVRMNAWPALSAIVERGDHLSPKLLGELMRRAKKAASTDSNEGVRRNAGLFLETAARSLSRR